MTATLATPETVTGINWYSDLGAPNHVTKDVSNVITRNKYMGQDRIHMGNGTGSSTHHMGPSSFLSQFCSKILPLKHLLHVPTITKNLVIVSKFVRDNNIFFEFHPNSCFIQDHISKVVLMAEKLRNGLYAFDHTQMGFQNQLQPLFP